MAIPSAEQTHTQRAPEERASQDSAEGHASSEQKTREAESLDAKTTYEVIRREGQKELAR